jgi:hypothetical protein
MNGKHLSEDELLDRLYGLGPEDNHLNVCAECGERWQALLARRRAVVDQAGSSVEVDSVQLSRQRAAVMDRIQHSKTRFLSWRTVTAFAGAAAMVLGFVVYHPQRPRATPVQTASSDSQFFSEIYSEMEQTEPRAVKPIRRLFQEQQQ